MTVRHGDQPVRPSHSPLDDDCDGFGLPAGGARDCRVIWWAVEVAAHTQGTRTIVHSNRPEEPDGWRRHGWIRDLAQRTTRDATRGPGLTRPPTDRAPLCSRPTRPKPSGAGRPPTWRAAGVVRDYPAMATHGASPRPGRTRRGERPEGRDQPKIRRQAMAAYRRRRRHHVAVRCSHTGRSVAPTEGRSWLAIALSRRQERRSSPSRSCDMGRASASTRTATRRPSSGASVRRRAGPRRCTQVRFGPSGRDGARASGPPFRCAGSRRGSAR